jgi:hypothetical protein
VSGAEAFAAGQTSCGAALGAGQSCVAEVTFSPTQVGSFAGALVLEALAAGSPQNVALWGSAFNPVSLGAATLPAGRLGRAYGPFDFRTLLSVSNESTPDLVLASWQVTAGSLPAGLSLDAATGVLSGTPTQLTAGQDFTVAATYRNNQGQQVFTIRVGEAVLEAVQVSAGGRHTCAVTPAGAVKCWGRNAEGQLGDGTSVNRSVPTQVVGLTSGAASVSVGGNFTCAVTTAGALLCWGHNNFGQLGDGTTTQRNIPVAVSGLGSGVASASAGMHHTCAVTAAGALRCWGLNSNGELGDGTTAQRHTPVTVSGLGSGVAGVSAGAGHTCARTSAGAAWCWGQNADGQLGDGTTAARSIPVAVSGLGQGVTSVSASGWHACAMTTAGDLRCWGRNGHGQLGDGTITNRSTPVSVVD